jgi:hypothetical protein
MVNNENSATTPAPVASTSGTTETASVGSNQRSETGTVEELAFRGETVRQIETIIEAFRAGRAKKAQSIVQIDQILTAESGGNMQLKSGALEQYSSTLDRIEFLATKSNQHGDRLTGVAAGKRKENDERGGGRPAEPDRNTSNDVRTDGVDAFLNELAKGKRSADDGADEGSESGGESGDESDTGVGDRGRSNKKQRIYESQMPWYEEERKARNGNIHLSCNKTRDILEIYQRDPTTVKRWIRCASSAPAAFPSSEWDSLVKGESVDLDVVFSSLHHIHSTDESVGRVGDSEIKFARPKPAAKVETSGQWTSAYNLVVKATAFLFPHRYDELRRYGDYIEELFSAKTDSIHPRLFMYDAAIRHKVGQGQNILLTDREEFVRYFEAIVANNGVGVEGASNESKGGQGKGGRGGGKSDICHRFNGENGCNLGTKCKYKHKCKKCGGGGHGKRDCKVEEAV